MDGAESKLPSISTTNQGPVTPAQAPLVLQPPRPPGVPGRVTALPSSTSAMTSSQPSCLPQPSSMVTGAIPPSVQAQLHGQAPLQQPTPEAVSAAAAATWHFMQQALLVGGSSNGGAATGASALAGGGGGPPGNNVSLFPPSIAAAPAPHQALLPAAPPFVHLAAKPQPPAFTGTPAGVPVTAMPSSNGTKVAHSFTIESNKRRADGSHVSTSASQVSTGSMTAKQHASSKSRKVAVKSDATASFASADAESSFPNDAASFSFDNLVPPQPKSDEEVAKMSPAERRRYERNLREQQRSYRISHQIKELRDVLDESNVPFKPNKFSILVSVTDYIKQLQSRAIMLDAEHHKLVTTIGQSSEAEAASSGAESGGSASRPPPLGERSRSSSEDSEKESSAGGDGFDHNQDLLMVRGIDYGGVFGRCPFALGVASLDGRVLACNEALERLFGCARLQMMEQSLFLYIRNHQEVFEAMADLLRRSNLGSERGDILPHNQGQLLFWCGKIMSQTAQKLQFTITLTTTPECNPKYFSFSASPI